MLSVIKMSGMINKKKYARVNKEYERIDRRRGYIKN